MIVSPVATQTQTASVSNSSAASGATTVSSDFETFLHMLSVQMRNQDPLNPIDSSDYAVQLATFSSVEQQVFTNDLLTQLSLQMGAMGMSDLAAWVGMEARVTGPAEFTGAPVDVVPIIERLADQAVLVVLDDAGVEVQRYSIDVASQSLEWSGVGDDGSPFPDGLYRFEVESRANGNIMGTYPADVYTQVYEARSDPNGTTLIGAGGVEFLSSEVLSLRRSS
ncbi:flagellar hook capping FlgD N-terminal domain-containing protein [Shimia sp.]|uniref:flagellar hook capping FlgD N-terminal domain-containing protein n=1 Tax=Shimia sp. TaxID=1954381 RepID=UPI00329830C2